MSSSSGDAARNRELWTQKHAEHTGAKAREHWAADEFSWGIWGIPESELRVEARHLARTQDGALASRLVRYAYLGRTFDWDIELERRIAALTPAQVREALARHLDLDRLSTVVAGDFE